MEYINVHLQFTSEKPGKWCYQLPGLNPTPWDNLRFLTLNKETKGNYFLIPFQTERMYAPQTSMMIRFPISRYVKCVLWLCWYDTTQNLLQIGEGVIRNHFCDTIKLEYLKTWNRVDGGKCWNDDRTKWETEQSKNKRQCLHDLNIHFHCGDTESPGKQICIHKYLGIATECHRTFI